MTATLTSESPSGFSDQDGGVSDGRMPPAGPSPAEYTAISPHKAGVVGRTVSHHD
jgi:hypothetical protein